MQQQPQQQPADTQVTMSAAIRAVLFATMRRKSPQPHDPNDAPGQYLAKCQNNILSEVHALTSQRMEGIRPQQTDEDGAQGFAGRRKGATVTLRIMGNKEVTVVGPMPRTASMDALPNDDGGDNDNERGERDQVAPSLQWNLIFMLNSFYIVMPRYATSSQEEERRGGGTVFHIEKGPKSGQPPAQGATDAVVTLTGPDDDGEEQEDKTKASSLRTQAYVVGYVRQHILEYKATLDLLATATLPPIMHSIASPPRRVGFIFRPPPAAEAAAAESRVNEKQASIVANMSHDLECIQGPPGTGKSTTIYHIVNTALPDDHVAILTCVQNKAVDAIAEKFARIEGGPRIVVFGNALSLGPTAATFTLEAQIDRNEAVLYADAASRKAERVCALIRAANRAFELAEAEFSDDDDDDDDDTPPSALTRTMSSRVAPSGWGRLWMAYLRERADGGSFYADEIRWKRISETRKHALRGVRTTARAEVLNSARAYLCTMDSLGRLRKTPNRPTIVVIDEAGTVPEYKLPLLVQRSECRAIVAIGDQNQLRPFSHHSAAASTAAADGFFHRVVAALPESGVPMLTTQYRMHGDMCAIVSEHFYQGSLSTDRMVELERYTTTYPPPGIFWVDHVGQERSIGRQGGGGKYNDTEVAIIKDFMASPEFARLLELHSQHPLPVPAEATLLQQQTTPSPTTDAAGPCAVMIITFYRHQLIKILAAAHRLGLYTPPHLEAAAAADEDDTSAIAAAAMPTSTGATMVAGSFVPGLRIVTVDSAQGSEAEVVILSGVRNNPRRKMGFVANKNRLCVALSRARKTLVVVGASSTLKESAPLADAIKLTRARPDGVAGSITTVFI